MIKFQKYYVTNGAVKARVTYSVSARVDGRKAVTLYGKDYSRSLGKVFGGDYIDDSDSMTDYFETGRVVLFEDSPHYAAALARATA